MDLNTLLLLIAVALLAGCFRQLTRLVACARHMARAAGPDLLARPPHGQTPMETSSKWTH